MLVFGAICLGYVASMYVANQDLLPTVEEVTGGPNKK
jgi:hypothetical protein